MCAETVLNFPRCQQGLGAPGSSDTLSVQAWHCNHFTDICRSRARKAARRNKTLVDAMAKRVCFLKTPEPPFPLGTHECCETGVRLTPTRGNFDVTEAPGLSLLPSLYRTLVSTAGHFAHRTPLKEPHVAKDSSEAKAGPRRI